MSAKPVLQEDGVFSILFVDSNNTNFTEKIGYIHDNILDSANSDSSKIATDLMTFSEGLTNQLLNATVVKASVTYEATIMED